MHEPVKDEKCSICHDVHFSDFEAGLIESQPDLCFLCHDAFTGKIVHRPVEKGLCGDCHQPHTASNRGMLSKPPGRLCLTCHQDKEDGTHGPVRMSGLCTKCHNPHASDYRNLLLAISTLDCRGCHEELTSGKNVHSALQEIGCGECHNPHSSPPVEKVSCIQCHEETTEGARLHPPLEEGCGECHATHTSPYGNQLLRSVPDLCTECHDDRTDGRHGKVLMGNDCSGCHNPHSSDEAYLLSGAAFRTECTSCHTDVLGKESRHTPVEEGRCSQCHNPHSDPSRETVPCGDCHGSLLRGSTVHPPAGEDCMECHSAHSSDFVYQLLDEPHEICIQCHEDYERGIHGRIVMGPLCTECHDPHSTNRPGMMLKEVDDAGCTNCHTDQMIGRFIHTPVTTERCPDCHNPHVEPPGQNLACTHCHDTLMQQPVKHEPAAGDCSNCHEIHSGARAMMLVDRVPDLCTSCHYGQEGGQHGETRTETTCLACHNPHSASGKGLTADLGKRQCTSCHEGKASGRHRHSALEKNGCDACHNPHSDPPRQTTSCEGCHSGLGDTSRAHGSRVRDRCHICHDPHSSDNPKMIVDSQVHESEKCLDCHASVRRKLQRGSFRHDAVSEDSCTECHTIHIGEKPYTVEPFPVSMNTPYSREAYTLCFDCHGHSMVEKRYTQDDTRFRSGMVNLHYTHVFRDGEKGYSCGTCHDAHAAYQPFLITREVPLSISKYQVKIDIRPDREGGTCFTNCHKERTYRR